MKITVELPDEMGERIDLEARKDGHTNRNAVIRKVLNSFLLSKFNILQLQRKKMNVNPQKQEPEP